MKAKHLFKILYSFEFKKQGENLNEKRNEKQN
jgi:hypothetical protein